MKIESPRTGARLSRRTLLKSGGVAGVATAAPSLAACGTSNKSEAIRIQYQQFGSGTVMRNHLRKIARQLRKRDSSMSTKLVPLVASEDDYFTKNELMMSSENTAPDLAFEDMFILESDAGAGYLRPLDSYVESWSRWKDFTHPAKKAVTSTDGRVYGVPNDTDARALWYHTGVFEAANIDLPWHPKSWGELLDTLRQIKSRKPDVIPFNIFSGKPQGEKASMQGFEMLLYGTGCTLYEEKSKKWVIGSKGFVDALKFIKTVFTEKLAPPVSDALDPNISDTITNTWLPQGKLAVNLDGSWISRAWDKGQPGEWSQWKKKMKLTTMPTQHGQGRGWLTLAGGWCWTIPKRSKQPDRAWTALQQLMHTKNAIDLAISDNEVTVRADVAQSDRYLGYSPTIEYFTNLGKHAVFRPAVAVYPQVSSEIQRAMDVVMTGKSSPEEAAKDYDSAVVKLVGTKNTSRG